MHACMHACMHVCIYVYTNVCMNVCMHACMYVYIYIHIYIYIFICTRIYIYIYVYTCAYLRTRLPRWKRPIPQNLIPSLLSIQAICPHIQRCSRYLSVTLLGCAQPCDLASVLTCKPLTRCGGQGMSQIHSTNHRTETGILSDCCNRHAEHVPSGPQAACLPEKTAGPCTLSLMGLTNYDWAHNPIYGQLWRL